MALPLAGGGATSVLAKAEQERVRSPLAVGWVEYCQILACESVGSETKHDSIGRSHRVEVKKQ